MEFNIRDSVIATVSCSTSKGIYVELENGQTAYAAFERLPKGTAVYCTILKKSTGRWLTLVSIDSVLYDTVSFA
jgi:hypothetical protein